MRNYLICHWCTSTRQSPLQPPREWVVPGVPCTANDVISSSSSITCNCARMLRHRHYTRKKGYDLFHLRRTLSSYSIQQTLDVVRKQTKNSCHSLTFSMVAGRTWKNDVLAKSSSRCRKSTEARCEGDCRVLWSFAALWERLTTCADRVDRVSRAPARKYAKQTKQSKTFETNTAYTRCLTFPYACERAQTFVRRFGNARERHQSTLAQLERHRDAHWPFHSALGVYSHKRTERSLPASCMNTRVHVITSMMSNQLYIYIYMYININK